MGFQKIVNVSRHSQMFYIDVTSKHALLFVDLSLDAMDSAGDQHLHIDHNIYKRRVDLNGNPIEEAKKEEIVSSTTKDKTVTD